MNNHAGGITRNGLRADPEKWRRTQQEAARRYAEKRRRQPTEKRPRTIATSKHANDWPRAIRRLAKSRSGGICEICQRHNASQLHHRKKRRHGDHSIENALHLCSVCHRQVHDDETNAKRCGWIVRSIDDPGTVKVIRKHQLVYLTSDGLYEAA